MLPLAVSIYAYSALGKFDAQFLNTVGKELIEFAGSFLPGSLSVALEPHRDILIYILPTGELLVALSLCVRPLRIYGSAAAICMQFQCYSAFLDVAKNHSLGVLIWNVMLIGQHVYLISCYRSDGQERASSHLTQFTTLQTVKRSPASFCTLGLGSYRTFLGENWLPGPLGVLVSIRRIPVGQELKFTGQSLRNWMNRFWNLSILTMMVINGTNSI